MRLRTVLVIGLLGLLLITVPVMAAPAASNGPIDQVLTIVRDIQTTVNTILTKLGAVATDVTTIKSTTDTINNKLTAQPTPIRYEYSSGPIAGPSSGSYSALAYVTNLGDSPAEACYYQYTKPTAGGSWLLLNGEPESLTIQPGETLFCSPGIVFDIAYQYRVRITTDSENVAPSLDIRTEANYDLVDAYHPGDFLKVEVYS